MHYTAEKQFKCTKSLPELENNFRAGFQVTFFTSHVSTSSEIHNIISLLFCRAQYNSQSFIEHDLTVYTNRKACHNFKGIRLQDGFSPRFNEQPLKFTAKIEENSLNEFNGNLGKLNFVNSREKDMFVKFPQGKL